MKPSRNALAGSDRFKLLKFAEMHRQEIPSYDVDHWLGRVKAELGLQITEANFHSTCDDVGSQRPKSRARTGQPGAKNNVRILKSLVLFCERLGGEYGVTFPPDLQFAADAIRAEWAEIVAARPEQKPLPLKR